MYQQTDGISIKSLLRAALANIFVGFQEAKLFKITNLPLFYKWYIDDTFMVFFLRLESRHFFNTVNQLYPVLTFTCEIEHNNSLPYLNVLVEHMNFSLQMTIYCKPMFTGSDTWWGSFCPSRCKINLIKILVHCALMICFKPKLAYELDFIKKTLLKNGYPEDVITYTIKSECLRFSTKPELGPERCLVYLKLPWIGNVSMQLLEQIKRSVNHCFNLVKLSHS